MKVEIEIPDGSQLFGVAVSYMSPLGAVHGGYHTYVDNPEALKDSSTAISLAIEKAQGGSSLWSPGD